MRAVRLITPGQPLEDQEVPVPTVGPDDVLVRVRAAGICRSDLHYRTGLSAVRTLPITLGHEVAGVIERAGSRVPGLVPGARVCLHYLISCGTCRLCRRGLEQFCAAGGMIGKTRDGGYAEFIVVPGRNAFLLPDEVPFEEGAILMCSSATSFHALHRARLRAGERVAVFGLGGLGMSAIQLAGTFGAAVVYAVDLDPAKLDLAAAFGAVPINAGQEDPVDAILRLTDGQGADVALEVIGLAATVRQALEVLGPGGRAAVVGLSDQTVELDPYAELIGREAELIGVNDHLASELPALIEHARSGALDLRRLVTRTVPLQAAAINEALDGLLEFEPGVVRTVVQPT